MAFTSYTPPLLLLGLLLRVQLYNHLHRQTHLSTEILSCAEEWGRRRHSQEFVKVTKGIRRMGRNRINPKAIIYF